MTRLRAALATAAVPALTLGLIGLAPAPASAAWTTSVTIHDARLQTCKGTVAGRPVIKFRLDNRRARHQHRGAIGAESGGRYLEVRPAAGKVSRVRAFVVRPGEFYIASVGEIDGPSAGGGIGRGGLPRCSA